MPLLAPRLAPHNGSGPHSVGSAEVQSGSAGTSGDGSLQRGAGTGRTSKRQGYVGAVDVWAWGKGLHAVRLCFGGEVWVERPKVECIADLSLHSSIGEVASYTSILAMGTVLGCDVLGGTLPEGGFLTRAPNFTQVDSTHA